MKALEVTNSDLEYLSEDELEEFKSWFKVQHNSFIQDNTLRVINENSEYVMGYDYDFYPDYNIVISTTLIFEGNCFDDIIECKPYVQQAFSVEEAWELIKEHVSQWYLDQFGF